MKLPLTPIHVIIGQNDSGKTSLLEAIFALFRSTEKQLVEAFPGDWQDRDLVFAGTETPAIQFEADFVAANGNVRSPLTYLLDVEFGKGRSCRAIEEWSQNSDLSRIREHGRGWTGVSRRFDLDPGPERENCNRIAEQFRSVSLYRFDPKLMAIPAAIDPKRKFRMDPREGRTDSGRAGDQPETPSTGVVPILVHRLCNQPESMRVRRRPLPFPQGKGLWQKVRFAKRQAFNSRSAGLVFVLDTKGNHPRQLEQLRRRRDFELSDYATAVGVAHPCVEAWLLSDGAAIMRAMGLPQQPEVPTEPESLPAPRAERARNPKIVLGRCGGLNRPLSSKETTQIAAEIRDLNAIRTRCPTSFAPFADEVAGRIKPIFETNGGDRAVP